MISVGPPELFYINAAQGWLELGNFDEAINELEHLTPSRQTHPEVLQIKWQIRAKEKNWQACQNLAEAMVDLLPDWPIGWINLANALYFSERTQEAYDFLRPKRHVT